MVRSVECCVPREVRFLQFRRHRVRIRFLMELLCFSLRVDLGVLVLVQEDADFLSVFVVFKLQGVVPGGRGRGGTRPMRRCQAT